jgi:hypothetical protein
MSTGRDARGPGGKIGIAVPSGAAGQHVTATTAPL